MTDQSPSRSAVALKAGSPLLAIRPTTLDDVARLAKLAVMSGMVKPQKLKKTWGEDSADTYEDGDTVLARATMIILQGLEIGVPPMQALQLMAMINGRIVLHSEGVPGVLWAHGFKIRQWIEGAGNARIAHTEITRPDGTKIERTFSVANAKKARLWSPEPKVKRKGKNGSYEVENDSPWHCYDERMLLARSLGFASKDGASDVTRGIMIREEAEDIARSRSMIDITPTNEATRADAPAERAFPDIDGADSEAVKTADAPAGADTENAAAPEASAGAQADNPADTTETVEPIADVDGLLQKLQEDRAFCDCEQDVIDLRQMYADVLPRLPPEARKQADKILSVE